MTTNRPILSVAIATFLGLSATASADDATVGTTRIEHWPDGKKAAFMMMFDDGCPSHVKNAIPELVKRHLTGTFFIVPDKGEYKAHLAFWEKEVPTLPGIVLGNHSFSHKGYSSVENAEEEMVQANETIFKLFPGKKPRLLSYATPGGVKNAISNEQILEIAAKHNLIVRPTFQGHGAAIHYKTGASILDAIDTAMTTGEAAYVIFHGVGGDWISFPLDQFAALLDGVETRSQSVWVSDPLSIHQYETERQSAKVSVTSATPTQIKLTLSSEADSSLYDQPLTLTTRTPSSWQKCQVTQGSIKSTAPIVDGHVRYHATPSSAPIVLTRI